MADELIDILDSSGKPTKKIRLKSEAHRLGLYHSSVHIWFYTEDGSVLLQKRTFNKDTYPNLWDISVAGHIGAGEIPQEAAIREVKEEIGLVIQEKDLIFLKVYLQEKIPKPDFFDNEFHHVYIARLKTPITALELQKEEVANIRLLPIQKFRSQLLDIKLKEKFVPHCTDYYSFIIKEITNRLE